MAGLGQHPQCNRGNVANVDHTHCMGLAQLMVIAALFMLLLSGLPSAMIPVTATAANDVKLSVHARSVSP